MLRHGSSRGAGPALQRAVTLVCAGPLAGPVSWSHATSSSGVTAAIGRARTRRTTHAPRLTTPGTLRTTPEVAGRNAPWCTTPVECAPERLESPRIWRSGRVRDSRRTRTRPKPAGSCTGDHQRLKRAGTRRDHADANSRYRGLQAPRDSPRRFYRGGGHSGRPPSKPPSRSRGLVEFRTVDAPQLDHTPRDHSVSRASPRAALTTRHSKAVASSETPRTQEIWSTSGQ